MTAEDRRWALALPTAAAPGPVSRHRDLVRALPALGYTGLWSVETAGPDAFTPLALASQWAPGLRLGTAIVPVHTRGPALLAQQAATLADLAPGRFTLGIGASSPGVVRNWNGIPYTEPYRRVRDTLRFLRRALAGEKVTDGGLGVRGFRLERPPPTPPSIALAALRPGMLRLAAREADAAITNWVSPDDVRAVRAEFGHDKELLAPICVLPTEDADLARVIGRRLLAAYLTVPAYRAFHDWLGRGTRLKALHESWAAGDRAAAAAAIPDEVVDDLIVHGSPAACRTRLHHYLDAGLTPIVGFGPLPGLDVRQAARSLAPSTT
ncbi:LLM class F420-dependent oxidoreductase [Actinocorallia populi]|uniref:LLM class F420-dependent oxidoreductase n=1 Tax=Actinocorallia populi TaxID=2079200 RepID=UPI001E2F8A01|nr:LLM class F420-dependent oxidoreductase [Actinocorallia populi]